MEGIKEGKNRNDVNIVYSYMKSPKLQFHKTNLLTSHLLDIHLTVFWEPRIHQETKQIPLMELIFLARRGK